MKLVIPILGEGISVKDVTFKLPSAGTLADVSSQADSGAYYEAVRSFIGGSLEEIDGEMIDKVRAKAVTNQMPFQSALQCIVEISKLIKEDDSVSGVYDCPECDTRFFAQKKGEGDTRDHTDDLTRIYMEDDARIFQYDFEESLTIEDGKGEVLTSVSKIMFRYPTIADCIKVSAMGIKDKSRFQMMILSECIVSYNQGEEPDGKWKNRYGKLIFERMELIDYRAITKLFSKYRLDLNVSRVCRNCGIDFEEEINIKNFFSSALSRA